MDVQKVNRRGKTHDAVIESKDQRWHCRNRLSLVFGSNEIEDLDTYIYGENSLEFKTIKFHQAKSKAIEEILDNCIDEYYRGHVTEIHTTLMEDGKTVAIEDNGIGFPLDKIKEVYTEFRTGSKFKDDEVDEKGFLFRTLGQNGLGAAATCLTSDSFIVRVRHYNTKKEQTYSFLDGALTVKKTPAKSFTGHSGVRVELVLAQEVYKNNIIDPDLLRKRIIDLAYNNPGLAFYFNKEKYLYENGLYELAQRINPEKARPFGYDKYIYETMTNKNKKAQGRIDFSLSLVVDRSSEQRERMISFVNSSPTFDGGFHHDRIKRSFINFFKEKLERTSKKENLNVVDNDVLTGLTFIIGITMPNARFESQTKRKLVRDNHLDKAVDIFMEKYLTKFAKSYPEFSDDVLERAKSRHRFEEFKDATKRGKQQKKQRVEKLLDANERRKRELCTLFICEGDSAIGGLRSARNKLYQGGIALKGKPMNVVQASIKDILDNQEFSDIMASIGLTIGHPVDFENMRYSKIVFLADSDVDGGHINTLLTNFFFTFWPELFEKGIIQIAKAPLFEVILDKGERVFAETENELEMLKEKHKKIHEIQRNKGLGEMSPEAFKYVLSRESFTKITIEDLESAKSMLQVCFGKDSSPRKDLLMDQDEYEKNHASKIPPATSGGSVSADKGQKQKKTTKKMTKPDHKAPKVIKLKTPSHTAYTDLVQEGLLNMKEKRAAKN
ncbi:MAG: hypothetical protein A2381_09215 [Bdellovibrionales bacterium RIFOXYB1_FULL_37_110]|nr:MAG: hypothetical protein A2181_06010 [Bdellovibrionales bacterium RIFOXYA1_FULL_38_20]OFZ49268.1 MAG: hypothetical protein A2417_17185 [Bdellovibrionales bacterium RIFOXYC1_FULL_37_79]OFZ58269.1 MAG: hypothetical protein A2381_09215 [Bdellovibrionales bacterium RIFOXYB1_FULL_37_110]OFZ61529.1 MAG: hypothetical protein A2577_00465 [Bdellovibrionales bacterium RIFOXYD1_FULL_36_51]